MSPFAAEVAAHWVAIGLYAVASVVITNAVLFQHEHRLARGRWLTVAGLCVHAGAIVVRWVASDHGPYMARHEVLSSNAFVLVVLLLAFIWRKPAWSGLAVVALPIAFLMVGAGLFGSTAMKELPPSLRSVWLVFHILFAKLGAGAFVLSATAAFFILRKRGGARGRLIDRLPPAEALDAYTVRFAAFGFVYWTFSVAAGSIWAHQAWGRYWGWDPVETWSLVTWLCYGSFLHAQRFFRWQGARTAWAALGCVAIAIATIFILPLAMAGLHGAYFQ